MDVQAQAGDNMFLAKKKRPSQSMPGFLRLNDEPVRLLSMALSDQSKEKDCIPKDSEKHVHGTTGTTGTRLGD